jgi:subtilisin family serine protease
VSGFAPEATIIFVDASTNDINWSGTQVVGSSFGDSVQLLEAVKFIFDRAGDRPCVINISLGTNGGPHDGSTLVERGIDQLVQERPNRAVVIAASNSYGDHIHAAGRLAVGESIDLTWNRPPSSGWQDELEVWYSGRDRISAEIILPDGTSAGTIEPGRTGRAEDNGRVVLLVANRLDDPNNGDNMIGIFVDDSLPPGLWTLRLTAVEVHADGAFHAWIERDDSSQASFQSKIDDDFTIGSISCGRSSIVVGSYDAHKPTTPLSWFSSAGPTRDGREKPELSAPGHAVSAAHSRTRTGVIPKSGTSMAAPAVAGALALLFGEARRRGVDLDIGRTRALLTQTVRRPAGGQWDPRWGAGKLDVAALLGALPAQAGPPPTTSSRPRKPSSRATKPARSKAKPGAKPKTAARRKPKKSAK